MGVVAEPQLVVVLVQSVCFAVDQPYSAVRVFDLLTSSYVPPTAVTSGLVGG